MQIWKETIKEIKTENTEIKIVLGEAKHAIEWLEKDKKILAQITGVNYKKIKKNVEQHLEVDVKFKTTYNKVRTKNMCDTVA